MSAYSVSGARRQAPSSSATTVVHTAVTEALKVVTVHRNAVALALCAVIVVVQPWILLGAFGWVESQGVVTTRQEVVAFSHRNQAAGFLMMLLLGLQAYVSDAGNGALPLALTRTRGRSTVALGKALFGLAAAGVGSVVATASAALAAGLLGPQGVGGAVPVGHWGWAVVTLTLSFTLYHLLGLVIGAIARAKAPAVAAAMILVWVVLPVVLSGAALEPTLLEVLRWALPTELAAGVLGWVSGGNTLLVDVDHPGLRLALLVCWLVALTGWWWRLITRRNFYPADAVGY